MNTPNEFQLHESAQQLLDKDLSAKLDWVYRDKFVVHALVKDPLSTLKESLQRPRVERPVCWLIIGPVNSGKSALVHRLQRDLGGDAEKKVGATNEFPLLVIEVPSRPTEPRLNLAIARALRMPVASEHESRKISDTILRNLIQRKVRMVVFVEMDHFDPLPEDEQTVVFDFIKNITNEGIVVVGVGTENCRESIEKHEALASRFRLKFLTGFAQGAEFGDFLTTLESFYPLPARSFLDSEPLRTTIFKRTNGVVGEVTLLLNEAAAWALRQGRPCIDDTALKSCAYTESLLRSEKRKS
ncbi:MAG: hypothetical protein C0518_06825 [Opitutus sp.]|nr:hypothetical protein [Opitutus sp.]